MSTRRASFWPLPFMTVLTMVLVGAVVFSGTGCAGGGERTPSPVPTAMPTPGPRGEEAVAAGKALFSDKGCAFCHGADGGGTAQIPAIVYRSRDAVVKQVRGGGWHMPAYGTDKVSDAELDKIVAFLETLK